MNALRKVSPSKDAYQSELACAFWGTVYLFLPLILITYAVDHFKYRQSWEWASYTLAALPIFSGLSFLGSFLFLKATKVDIHEEYVVKKNSHKNKFKFITERLTDNGFFPVLEEMFSIMYFLPLFIFLPLWILAIASPGAEKFVTNAVVCWVTAGLLLFVAPRLALYLPLTLNIQGKKYFSTKDHPAPADDNSAP
ncbi:MAG: hypothetical protein K0R10_2759 [Alphaproteobacteria bacterium]|nr:hypothetical protein [Alphaproteobacteria bacterium]